MGRREIGYSLIEALVCIAVLAVAAGLAAPGLGALAERQALDAAADDLQRAVNFARALAVNSGSLVTLCPSADGRRCGGAWEAGAIIFVDRDGDRVVDTEDGIAWRVTAAERPVTIRFRSFPNRQYLQMTTLGFTRDQNGSFTLCPLSADARLAQQVVLSRGGRARRAQDSDGDGIREDSQGKPLVCP